MLGGMIGPIVPDASVTPTLKSSSKPAFRCASSSIEPIPAQSAARDPAKRLSVGELD